MKDSLKNYTVEELNKSLEDISKYPVTELKSRLMAEIKNRRKKDKFKEYIIKNTTRRDGIAIYKCHFTGLSFSWEDSDSHFDYLIEKKIITL